MNIEPPSAVNIGPLAADVTDVDAVAVGTPKIEKVENSVVVQVTDLAEVLTEQSESSLQELPSWR